MPNGKTQESVISKHEHVHAKLYLNISKLCMYAVTFGCKIYAFWVHVYGSVGCKVCGSWVQVYGYFWAHVYAFWVHVYGSVGCMYAVVVYIFMAASPLLRIKENGTEGRQ